jgi:hypothetical protein
MARIQRPKSPNNWAVLLSNGWRKMHVIHGGGAGFATFIGIVASIATIIAAIAGIGGGGGSRRDGR